jgi:hypothetical protein
MASFVFWNKCCISCLNYKLENRFIPLTNSMKLSTTREATNCVPTWYFLSIYGTRRFITAFWARPIQSTPLHPISPRSIIILHTDLHLVLPSGFFYSGFPTNNLYAFLFSPIKATCPAYLIVFDFNILVILVEEYKSRSSLLCSFLHPLVTSSPFGLTLLKTLSSNTLSLCKVK